MKTFSGNQIITWTLKMASKIINFTSVTTISDVGDLADDEIDLVSNVPLHFMKEI